MLVLDFKEFFHAHNIEYREHGKNWHKGWIQINCPNCDDTGFHGGCNLNGGYYHCWRCGGSNDINLIMALLSVSFTTAKGIKRAFAVDAMPTAAATKQQRPTELKLPINCGELEPRHRQYLADRNYCPDEIQRLWQIKATGPIGPYKHRIIIPIMYEGQMISYQGRDITGLSDSRYKACATSEEVIHHKLVCYGIDHVKSSCVVVEGITDVWRLGYGAVATFGVEYTASQVLLIARRVRKATIFYDPGALGKAEQLEADLSALGVETSIIYSTSCDPGDLPDFEAQQIMAGIT